MKKTFFAAAALASALAVAGCNTPGERAAGGAAIGAVGGALIGNAIGGNTGSTLAGAAITAVIRSGCTQLELGDPLQRMLLGVIIICAVVIDQLRQRRMTAGA